MNLSSRKRMARPKYHFAASIVLILLPGIALLLSGCNLQSNSIVDGTVLNLKATILVKNQFGGGLIKNAAVKIQPSVLIDGTTVYIDSASAQSDIGGTAVVQTDETINTPAEDISGKVPRVSITVSHDDYKTADAVAYGSGLTLDETSGEYSSSLGTTIQLTVKPVE
jgi:hypothetical protein